MVEANERAVFCTLRTRLTCEVYAGAERVAVRQAFNEAAIDRGPGLYMLLMECYVDGNYVTTIQARRWPFTGCFLLAMLAGPPQS